ncbi:MAG: PEGA domain-containing protein [Candidatus Electryonea clarkiae]|nr:PEGA domain-containing protein [Candidatus Electryonea clarkiae]MDP8289078.1 PEGA domain-containing protein [Candidatus Electryonea clarkiae]
MFTGRQKNILLPAILLQIVITLLITHLSSAQSGGKFQIAVVDLEMAGGIPDNYRRTLSDRLRLELGNTGRFTIVERNAMENILSEQGFQMSGCTTDECAVEVGRLLGVDRMVAGSIGYVGKTYSIIIRMIDVESGSILTQKGVDCTCEIDEVLSSRIREAARLIAGLEIQGSGENVPSIAGFGDLFIKSDPPGATVIIDDTKLKQTTPSVFEKLSAGPHSVRLKKGNLVAVSPVFVARDDITRLDLKLEKGMASLRVYSNPFEAILTLDNKTVGPTPQSINGLAVGQHSLKLTFPGYVDHEELVTLNAGDEKRIDKKLFKAGKFKIIADPEGAEIFFEGSSRQNSPVTIENLPPGKYEITAVLPRYRTWKHLMPLAEGEEKELSITLAPKVASIWISTPLKDVKTFINGNEIQENLPVEIPNLRMGEYKIEVTRPDYETWTETVKVESEKKYTVFARMVKQKGILGFSGLPANTRVILEGKEVGITPLDNKPLEVGEYSVLLQKPGYKPGESRQIIIKNKSKTPVTFNLKSKSKTKSVLYSSLLPGSGQIYAERSTFGWNYALGEALGIGYVLYTIFDYNNKANDYNTARSAYNNAIAASDISSTYSNMQSTFDDTESAKTQIYIAGLIAGGLYAWNIIDAVLFNKVGESNTALANRNDRNIQFVFSPVENSSGTESIGVSIGINFNCSGRIGR